MASKSVWPEVAVGAIVVGVAVYAFIVITEGDNANSVSKSPLSGELVDASSSDVNLMCLAQAQKSWDTFVSLSSGPGIPTQSDEERMSVFYDMFGDCGLTDEQIYSRWQAAGSRG